MTTQIFVASTAFGLATLVAALDDEQFGVAERRILVTTNNAAVPETTFGLVDVAGVSTLLSRFATVYDYNEAIAPQHPSAWRPRTVDLPLWQRYLRGLWELKDDPVHLVVESIQANPALALGQIFADAAVDVYADGLMSYGPTRVTLPDQLATRITRLLHLDLVPGLAPVLLTESDVEPELIRSDSFRQVITEMACTEPPSVVPAPAKPTVLLLGQYLAAARILTEAEELDLHLQMMQGAARLGHRDLVFKPHPSAPVQSCQPLRDEAHRLGVTLTVRDEPQLAETLLAGGSFALVIGCFSTALLTAQTCYGLPVARVGTELLLERLRPYENSNRIPVTLVHALVPGLETCGGEDGCAPDRRQGLPLDELVATVSYCMQAKRYPHLRPVAVAVLSRHYAQVRVYVKRRRLSRLELPGGLDQPVAVLGPPRSRLRRHAGQAMRTVLRSERSRRLAATARAVRRRPVPR